MSFQDASEQFSDLHPYGWSEGELSSMLWILLSILVLAILAYVYSAWRQVRSNGLSWRSLSARRKFTAAQQERIDRAETRFIVRRQQANNNG